MKKILIFSSLFILIDLLSKFLVVSFLGNDLILIKDIFRLSYAENYGIAFSVKIPYYLIFIMNISIVVAFIIFIKKELKTDLLITQLASSMIIGGGMANLIDRAINGFVIDFISVLSYPTFNIADIFITLGVLFLLVFYAKISRTSKNKND